MKKDIFNGKVKSEYRKGLLGSFIFGSIIFLACATLFLCFAFLYDNVEDGVEILLLVMSGLSYFSSVFYPLTSILCIRKYPKYKKLTSLLIKDYLLIDDTDKANPNLF